MKKQRLTEKDLLLFIHDQAKDNWYKNKIEVTDKIITESFTTFVGFPLLPLVCSAGNVQGVPTTQPEAHSN